MRLANDWELPDELSSDSVRCCCVDRAAGDAFSSPVEESLANDRLVARGTWPLASDDCVSRVGIRVVLWAALLLLRVAF